LSVAAISTALDEFRTAVGSAHLTTTADALKAAATATFATTAAVGAIIRPGSRDEVQQCVRIANRYGVPLYPISTGKNWGYGSRAPVRDGVILDLGRLNRIVDFDEAMAQARRGAPGDGERARRLLDAARLQFEALGMTGWLRHAGELSLQLT